MLNASIAGTIGRDAEVRVAGQTNVTGWSVAVEQRGKDGKVTQWINCSLWGKRGDALSQHVRKGGKIACAGELTTREYNNKTYLELNVTEVTLLGGKPDADRTPEYAGGTQASATMDDSIPF